MSVKFSKQAGGKRGFYLSIPTNYSKNNKYKLLFVFPGTDTKGKEMQEFVGKSWGKFAGLEENMPNTIFVYPDPKWRHFEGWETTNGGWLLGKYGGNAAGMEDIYFTEELLNWLLKKYSIDEQRVFATGHSWGGDMTAVVGCFMGDRLRAIAPVAANRPYWFDSGDELLECNGSPAVWTFFGNKDEHFAESETTKGDFGREQNDFWLKKYACSKKPKTLQIEPFGESVEYTGGSSNVRFSLYSPDFYGKTNQPGHQPPNWYAVEVAKWFNSF